ncbi:MAG: FMN-binding protein [Eubacteriales bacterium]|nr:FMN-binding protein [Eubacteriales bacterium]
MKRLKAIVMGLLFGVMTGGMITSIWLTTAGKSQKNTVAGRQTKEKQDQTDERSLETTEIYVLKDGEYEGVGVGYGGEIKVKVTITEGKISRIELLENHETPEFLNMARAIIAHMIQQQTADVDVISGATFSSNGIKEAVTAALAGVEKIKITVSRDEAAERAKEHAEQTETGREDSEKSKNESTTTLPAPESATQSVSVVGTDQNTELIDGEYEGSGQGYRGTITVRITIQGGRLTDIQLVSAGDDVAYISKAKAVITALLSSGGQSVDTVSGATYSSRGIIAAVNDALVKAMRTKPVSDGNNGQSDNAVVTKPSVSDNRTDHRDDTGRDGSINERKQPETAQLGEAADGVYEAEATSGQYFELNGPTKIRLEIKNNVIAKAEIVSFADDTAYGEGSEKVWVKQKITRLLTDLSGADKTRLLEVARQLEQKKGEAYDSISGATVSAKGVMTAVVKALQSAAVGQNLTLHNSPRKLKSQTEKTQSQTEKPQVDQPRSQTEKPQAEKPRPQNEKPQAEKPRPQTEEPQVDQPQAQTEKPQNEKSDQKKEAPKEKAPLRPEEVQLTAETMIADGEYSGTAVYSRYAQSRGANVVRIEIKDGRIVKAVSETYTDDDLPMFKASRERILTSVNGKTVADILEMYQQMENRSGTEYDAISQATQTAKGHLSAVLEALKQAAAKQQNNDMQGME